MKSKPDQYRRALRNVTYWIDGRPYYRAANGTPMQMPASVERRVKRAVREVHRS